MALKKDLSSLQQHCFFKTNFAWKFCFQFCGQVYYYFMILFWEKERMKKKLFEIFGSLRFCNCLCTPHSHTPSKWLIKRGELRNILKCFANILYWDIETSLCVEKNEKNFWPKHLFVCLFIQIGSKIEKINKYENSINIG